MTQIASTKNTVSDGGAKLSAMDIATASLEKVFGTECPKYCLNDYANALISRDTRLSNYWEWVVHQIEADKACDDGPSVEQVIATQARKSKNKISP